MTAPRSPLFAAADRLVDVVVAAAPVRATFAGIPGHDHRWDDLSPAGLARRDALWRDARRQIAGAPVADPWDALARDAIVDHCDRAVAHHASGDDHYALNNIASPFQLIPMVLDLMPTGTSAAVAAVVARLATVGSALEGYQRTLSAGLQTGRVVARRQVEVALDQGRVHAGDHSAFLAVADRCAQGAPEQAAAARSAAAHAQQAYARLCGWLEGQYLPHAPVDDAVGPDRYAREARRHLGLSLDLDEAYRWGWAEVHRIEAEMAAVAAQIRPGASVPEVVAALRQDPTWCDPTADAFLDRMRARQHRALEVLDGVHFAVPESVRRIDVRLAPPGGPLGAYYVGPSEDMSRPGAVCYALERDTDIPFFAEVSTAYHEGFPGHHLHVATTVQHGDRLSRFQRLICRSTGHNEGWALYAEHLMQELGFLESPELVLGKLICEVVRAWRVVVDIGLHLKLPLPVDAPLHPGERWTAAIAVEAMRERAFLGHDTAVSNVVRYLGWPGQAITYKIGQRVVLDLREEQRAALGPDFNLAQFHASVVGVGSVGLGLLQRLVREAGAAPSA